MSKEREYLLQAANILSDFTEFDKFASTIYELLAQPEQNLREDLREEPVAWMYDLDMMIHPISNTRSLRFGKLTSIDPAVRSLQDAVNIRPLYTAPPKREPLSDEAICQILLKKEWKGFVDLVRQIEKAHGIGVDEE
jgi:hypothetical protein